MVYEANQVVSATCCDLNARLSPYSIVCLVQDAVSVFTGMLGLNNINMRSKFGAMWVFTKNKVEILAQRPIWNENFRIRSYLVRKSAIILVVATEFLDSSGALFAYAKLEMCALDIASRKILRLNALGIDELECNQDAIETNFDKLGESTKIISEVKVSSENIDFSLHTNNAQYLRFLLNTYSVEELKSKDFKCIEVYFVEESRENDILTIAKHSEGKFDIFTIYKGEEIVTKAKIEFQ